MSHTTEIIGGIGGTTNIMLFTETGVTPGLNIHAKNFSGIGTDMHGDFTHAD